jgi:hypothetical protein
VTTTQESVAPICPSPAVPPASSPRRGVAVHALVYLLLLVGLFAFTDLHASWTLDDGAYATQVKVLNETGGWAYPYRWADRDPTSRFAPVSHSVETTDATYPYVKRPVWILLLQTSTKVFGTPLGLFVPSLLGAWAAALVAWSLAERLEAGRGPLGFWAVALGPVVVHSSAMWAHTWAAALGGVLAVVVVDAHRGVLGRRHVAVAVAASVALVSIRTDGLLAVLAVALALVLASRRPGAGRRSDARVISRSVLLVAAAAVTYLGTASWGHHLAPGRWRAPRDVIYTNVGLLSGRWSGFVASFLSGGLGSTSGIALAWLAIGCSVVAGILLTRRAPPWLVGGFVTVSLLVLALRQYAVARFDLGGALLALPLVTVGLGCLIANRVHRPRTLSAGAMLGVFVGMHVVLVVATQYPEGGSIDWGGRFLFPVLVPATVLAALAVLHRSVALTGASGRSATAVILVVLVALPSSIGWLSAHDLRRVMGTTTDRLDAPAGTTVIRLGRSITRGSWSLLPERDVLSAESSTAPAALRMLRPGRSLPVLVIGGGADRVRSPGYDRTVVSSDEVLFRPS